MYRFYKHGGQWYYIKKGSEKAEHVGTYALEGILGVTGTRKVIAFCPQPDGCDIEVTVENGFIIEAEIVEEQHYCVTDASGNEITGESFNREERIEFYAEAC